MKKYEKFIFEAVEFNEKSMTARFHYSLDGELKFTEIIEWNRKPENSFSEEMLQAALQTAHLVLGVSYYKAYLPEKIIITNQEISKDQADFLNSLYLNGLGEFIYQNKLQFTDIAKFPSEKTNSSVVKVKKIYSSNVKTLVPMSGGKDSLLTAEILRTNNIDFTPVYVTTDGNFPKVISEFGEPIVITRTIAPKLIEQNSRDAYNGHVPFSAIMASILTATSILFGYTDIVLSHESSADEETTQYDGHKINHQYSKSSQFEVKMQNYLKQNVSSNLNYFSLLRELAELDIHKIFVEKGLFNKFFGNWSSCNLANYKQGNNTSNLQWCGDCSKCANAFLLFTPFVPKAKLIEMFNGKNLATDKSLASTFKELLGMKDSKPFECVGEINELREAARLAVETGDWPELESYDTQPKQLPTIQSVKTKIPVKYKSATENFLH